MKYRKEPDRVEVVENDKAGAFSPGQGGHFRKGNNIQKNLIDLTYLPYVIYYGIKGGKENETKELSC